MRHFLPLTTLALLPGAALGIRTHRHWIEDSRVPDLSKEDIKNTSAPHRFRQVLDHYPTEAEYAPHPPENTTFHQRWWYNVAHYKPGGPVLFQDPGEGPGGQYAVSEGYMPGALAAELGAAVIALEHRYFGRSYPFDIQTTDNMRFLTVRQSLADIALFAQTVEIPELKAKGIDIQAPGTPWIFYGGSYPGAKAVFARVTYPELFLGAFASSAVTHAEADYWQYVDVPRQYLPHLCTAYAVSAQSAIDRLWALNDKQVDHELTVMFNVKGVNKITFANLLSEFVFTWQSSGQRGVYDGTWNPPATYGFYLDTMCDAMVNTTIPKPSSRYNKHLLQAILPIFNKPDSTVVDEFDIAGVTYNTTDAFIDDVLSSFAAWADLFSQYFRRAEDFNQKNNHTLTEDPELITGDDGLSWDWLVCNEFGYEQVAAPKGTPSLISRRLSYHQAWKEYCIDTWPAGEYYQLPNPVNTSSIAAFGDYDPQTTNVVMIGGELDPWRPVTPLVNGNHYRNTTDSPSYIIPEAGHCADFGEPHVVGVWPARIKVVHELYVKTAKLWLADWESPAKRHLRRSRHAHNF